MTYTIRAAKKTAKGWKATYTKINVGDVIDGWKITGNPIYGHDYMDIMYVHTENGSLGAIVNMGKYGFRPYVNPKDIDDPYYNRWIFPVERV
jgi:hypothetical protein